MTKINWNDYKLIKINVRTKQFVFCTKKDWIEQSSKDRYKDNQRVTPVLAFDVSNPHCVWLYKKESTLVRTNYDKVQEVTNWIAIEVDDFDRDNLLLHIIDVISRYNIEEAKFDE